MEKVQQLAELLFGFERAQEWLHQRNVRLKGDTPWSACQKGLEELVIQILHSYMPRR